MFCHKQTRGLAAPALNSALPNLEAARIALLKAAPHSLDGQLEPSCLRICLVEDSVGSQMDVLFWQLKHGHPDNQVMYPCSGAV